MEHKVVAKNTLFQLLAKISSAGIGLLATIILFSLLGQNGYGQFTSVTVVIGFFALFLDFGLNAIFLQEENTTHWQSLFSFRLLLGCVIVLLFLSFSFFSFQDSLLMPFSNLRMSLLFYSLSLFGQALLLSASAIFQKRLSYQHLFVATLSGSVVSLLCIGIAALIAPSLFSMLASYLIGTLCSGIVAVYLCKQPIKLQLDISYLKQLVKESLPLGAMLVCNLIYFRIDTVLLTSLSTSSQVGDYGLAYRFFDFLIAIPLFLSNSLYPLLLRTRKNSRIDKLIVTKYLAIFLIISLIFLALSWFAVPLLLQLIHHTSHAIVLFHLLLLFLPVFFLTSFLQWLLITFTKQRFLVWVYVIAAIINIVLNLYYLPQFGAVAAAIITGMSEVFVLLALSIKLGHLIKQQEIA